MKIRKIYSLQHKIKNMKYIQLILLLLISCQLNLKAQKASLEFSKIGQYAIQYQSPNNEKDMGAVVLFDKGKSYFIVKEDRLLQNGQQYLYAKKTFKNENFEIIHERTTRIKILSEAGLKWATVEILLNKDKKGAYERLYDIEAYTYNVKDHKIIKTKFVVPNSEEQRISSKTFTMPKVKIGSIIEYKYKIKTQDLHNLRDWYFQWKIPVKYSEYEVSTIPFFEYQWTLQGASKFASYKTDISNSITQHIGEVEFKDKRSIYVMENIPAFNNENYITSINDYIIKLDFHLSQIRNLKGVTIKYADTWNKLIDGFLKNKHFGKFIKKSNKRANKVLDLKMIKKKSDEEKFNYIIDYVKNNYIWDGTLNRYASQSVKELIKNKRGNSTDLNLFTIGLLQAVGIDAKAILTSTRGNGNVHKKYPFIHYFNYVIIGANINSKLILTDSTEPLLSNNRLPVLCLNDNGLIIKKGQEEWVNLKITYPTETRTNLSLNIKDKNIEIDVDKIANEYSALWYRGNCGDNKESLKKYINSEGFTPIESSTKVKNNANIKKPYILTFKANTVIKNVNDKMHVSPFLNQTLLKNPFTQEIRTYPIDMVYPEKKSYSSTMNIPEGYKIDFTPSELSITNSIFDLKYTVSVDKDKLKVDFDYYFKKSIYSSKQYNLIKYYFKQIIEKGNEKIVFSKI